MAIALRIEPEDLTVDPGREAVFTVHVVNQSGVVDRVALDVLGSAGAWSRTDPQAVALFPGTDGTATLVVTPPLGTPLGPVPLGIRATAETSGAVEVGEANLNVGASRTVEAELRPRTTTGKRRATSVIVLHNLGNAPTHVQVVATDPDDAIVFDAPRALQIGPGITAELPLRMRLPSREKQGATLPYQVLVEGGDTGQSLDGQVRQPAKKRWPIVAALMALVLLAAAFALLKPENAVAIRDGAADQPSTTTLPGETTSVPGATTLPGASPGDPAAPGQPGAPGAPEPGAPAPGEPAPGAPALGVAATTPAPGAPAPAGPIGGVVPTTAPGTTRPALPCPAKTAAADVTAQRVACAWELKRLNEVPESTTAEGATALRGITPVGDQKVDKVVRERTGDRVLFSGCVANRGVASMLVPFSGTIAGRVHGATGCTAVLAAPSANAG